MARKQVNAIELLEEQHRAVEEMFEQLEKGKGDKGELLEKLAEALVAHMVAEERVFYPAVSARQTEDKLREAVEEHLSAKRVLADLLDTSPEDEQFEARCKVLQEQIEHHVEEEEGELFPEVRKLMSEDELLALAAEMEEVRAELQEEGSPREVLSSEVSAPAEV